MTKVLKKLGLYAEPKAKSSTGIRHKMCESGQIEFFLQRKGFITEVVKSICLCTRGSRLDFPLPKIACIKIIKNKKEFLLQPAALSLPRSCARINSNFAMCKKRLTNYINYDRFVY